MFLDALIAWLVAAAGDRVLGLVTGSADERKLRQALRLAIDTVVADTPPDRRDKITRALRDEFAAPPRVKFDLAKPFRETLRDAVVAQLEPLAGYVAEDTGLPFYEDARLDPDQFPNDLAGAIDTAIRQVAATGGLSALAARLDADYMRSGMAELGIAIGEQSGMLGAALEARGADQASGRLAQVRERLTGVPAAARPGLEEALAGNPAGIEQLILSVTDPLVSPAETVEAWVRNPPAFLGTPDLPMQHGVWVALGDIAAAYGLHHEACIAFQRAVAAGSARTTYLLARAAWAALQAGDRASAESSVAAARSANTPESALDVVTALLGLPAESESPGLGTGMAAGSPSEAAAGRAPAEPGDQQLRDGLRRHLGGWDPQHPADRDMRARIGAQVELTDPSHSVAIRYNAALRFLDDALARGWLDDTALAAANVLRLRATGPTPADRSGDLRRAEQFAVTVRDADRRARRDSSPAVRVAVAAASEAGRHRRVIALGSAEYGEATAKEATDPQVVEQVVLAAAKGVPSVADALAADLGQIPDGFVQAWAQALLGMRCSSLSRQDRIAMWEQALAAATTDDQRREALQGLAAAGADDLPGLDELLATDPATAAEWRARAALARGDPETAVSLAYPFRDTHGSAAGLLAEAYATLGQTGAAVDTLTTAASRFDHDDLVVRAAEISARAGDSARAEELFNGVLRTAATSWAGLGRARALLGDLQADRGAWPDAIASWGSALEEDPYLEPARWQLTYALAARGEHAQAWAVITADPDAPTDTPIPGNPPTPNAAHLALVLIRRNSDRTTLVTHGLQYLKQFGDDERFAGRTLALLSTPWGDSDSETLDPALQTQLEHELNAFVNRNPDSPYLRRRGGSPAELANHLNQEGRPSPELAAGARKASLGVIRGNQPLGVLSIFSRRPYAHSVVTLPVGILTAVGHAEEHMASIADASLTLGIQPPPVPPSRAASASGPTVRADPAHGPRLRLAAITPTAAVIVDTTALYVRTLLPDLADVLASGIRELLVTDDAYADIITARDEILLPTAGTWVVDPETGQGTLIPLDPAMHTRQKAAADALLTLATTCRRLPTPAAGLHDLDALTGAGIDPWASGIRLAAVRSSALWADDIALRLLARGLGVPAFSTLALLDAHARIGRITADQREDALRRLICGYVGDFPPEDLRLRALAARDSNSRGAVLSAMAKPAFWSAPLLAISVYGSLSSDLNASVPQTVADLLHASILGITRADFPTQQIEDLCARVTAATINTVGPLGDVPQLLQALRAALKSADPPIADILPAVIHHLMSAFERILTAKGQKDASLAADNVRALFARCSPEDQSTMRRAILLSR